MTLHEALKQAGYRNVDPSTLEITEQVLTLSVQQYPLLQPLSSLLKKITDAKQLEDARSEIMNEIGRLNSQRAALRQSKQKAEQDLETERQALIQEQGTLTAQRAALQKIKDGNAKKRADIEALQNELAALPKENEMKQKYETTQKMIEEAKKNPWLAPQVREKIQQVWNELPSDKLDEQIISKHH